ncbi:MAG: hypothetical protein HKN03_12440 [Acidimicrobiales bacterium]|nr:hypothetical protein [Acidimicrobiales bacterium]
MKRPPIETDPSAAFLWGSIGVAITLGFTYLGFFAPRANSLTSGAVGGAMAGAAVFASWLSWRRQTVRPPAPEAEYLAVGWLAAYLALLLLAMTERSISLADSFTILPPLGVVPMALRMALSDDGNPLGMARRVARNSHRVIGLLLSVLGGLFLISGFFAYVAPLPLIAGLFHLRAASVYRSQHPSGSERDPRLRSTDP